MSSITMRNSTLAVALAIVFFIGSASAQNHNPNTSAGDDSGSLKNLFSFVGNFFSGTSGELETLLKKGDIDGAYSVYVTNLDYFEKTPGAKPAVDKLAASINGRARDGRLALIRRLEAVNMAIPVSDWASDRQLLSEAETEVEANAMNLVTVRSEYVAPELDTLRKAYDKVRNAVVAAAPRGFSRYDLSMKPVFFDVYAADLKPPESAALVAGQINGMADAVASAPLERANCILENYLPFVTDDGVRQQLLRTWRVAYQNEKGWKAPLAMNQKMEIMASQKKQFPFFADIKLKVAVLPMIPPGMSQPRLDLARSRADTLARSLEGNLLDPVDTTQAPARLAELKGEYDMIVLADVGRLYGSEAVLGAGTETGRFLVRNDLRINPEQAHVVQELNAAKSKLARAEIEQKQAQAQAQQLAGGTSQGMAFLGVISASASVFSTGAAKEEVDRLQSKLLNTPQTISTPVYQEYQRKTTRYRLTAAAPLTAYVYNPELNQLYRVAKTVVETDEYTSVENPNPTDPDAKPLTAEDRRRRRDALIERTLAKIPDNFLSFDTLGQAPAADSFELERLSKVLAEDQVKLRKEIESARTSAVASRK